MRALKQTLDAAHEGRISAAAGDGIPTNNTNASYRGSHCLLEMPTGTGKTVSLLSLITSYQFAHPDRTGKLVYCTRTVPEMNAVMKELGVVLKYRMEQLELDGSLRGGVVSEEEEEKVEVTTSVRVVQDGNVGEEQEVVKKRKIYTAKKRVKEKSKSGGGIAGPHKDLGLLALCLSSRRNMCIHDRVINESDREAVDAACRGMTASWVLEKSRKDPGSIETCPYFDSFTADGGEGTSLPTGIFDLEELKKWGSVKGWCPYFLTRRAINHANVLVFNYQYLLDPKIAKMVSAELEAESIIVFDEAHNIDRFVLLQSDAL